MSDHLNRSITQQTERIRIKQRRRKWRHRVVSLLACITVFCTTYALVIPAVTMTGEVYCGSEEHEHTLQCYSNPEADVEDSAVWERMLANVTLTGNRKKDVLAVAETQLGYSESRQNYLVSADGDTLRGYTRYGAWYGEPYADWSAMFVSFCLHYAGVPESVIPYAQSCGQWADELSLADPENFHCDEAYQPAAGDIVFFDRNHDGCADHVGLVRQYNAADASLSTIEGDRSGQVGAGFYQGVHADVLGCYALPQDSEQTPETDGASYAKLAGMLDELNRLMPSDAQSLYRKTGVVERAIEAAYDAASITQSEYTGLLTRLNGICDAWELAAPFAANKPSSESGQADIKVVPAPDYVGSIPSPGNRWQITKEEYIGREQSNKTAVDGDRDGTQDVYIQKNVVPTDTENEFLVYLSMDKKMTWEKFFDESGIYITTSNKYKDDPVGTVYDKGDIVGNASKLMPKNEKGTYTNKYYVQFNVYETHSSASPIYSYFDWRYGDTPNCSKGTVFLKAPFLGYLVIGRSVNYKYSGGGAGNPFVVDIYLDEPSLSVDFALYDTSFDSVTDILGSQIEFLDFVAADGQKSYTAGTHTIEWSPKDNEGVVSAVYRDRTNTITGWENNICQLVYRVRLRTEDAGFNSCADHLDSKQASIDAGESYAVNRNAVLQYHFEPIPGATGTASGSMTAVYPVPEVRGTLYDLRFTKVNEYGRGLSGAVFGLFEEDGTTPVPDAAGNAWTVTTVSGELSGFTDLPCGTYVLKELKPPLHYSAGGESSWTIRLCYTEDQSMKDLILDETDGQNLRYKAKDAANGRWEIVNQRGDIFYELSILKLGRSGDGTETALSGVGFSISNPDGTEPIVQNTEENGIITIKKRFVPGIEYVITELTPPDGYHSLPAPIRFKVMDDKENDTLTAVLVNESELAGSAALQLRTDENGADILELTVYNDAGYELPKTGGIGTTSFYILGGLMAAGAAILLITKRRMSVRG